MKRAGHKSEQKRRGSVTYGADRKNEVDKIFMISLGLRAVQRNTAR